MKVFERHAKLEVIQLEVQVSLDGQGRPQYGSPIDLDARVVLQDDVVRTASGESVRSIATIWIDGQQSPLPHFNDRLATAQGLVGIVIERMDGRNIQAGVLDHVRLKIREEG